MTIHSADDENVLVFSKRPGDDVVIVVVNLDPHGARETTVHLNMPALGMGWHDSFVVYDEITDPDLELEGSTTTCASTPATNLPTS